MPNSDQNDNDDFNEDEDDELEFITETSMMQEYMKQVSLIAM